MFIIHGLVLADEYRIVQNYCPSIYTSKMLVHFNQTLKVVCLYINIHLCVNVYKMLKLL